MLSLSKLLMISICLLLVNSNGYANETAIRTIILEAQGESLEGQIAVAEIIRNRAIKANKSVESVCMAHKQFSAWNDSSLASNKLRRASGEVYQRASRAWEESRTSNLTKGSRHYHTVDVSPRWARGHKPVARIGHHVFYNDIR